MAYPSSIDSFTTKTDNVDDVLAEHINTIQSAIEAIETELGTDPAGSVADVKTRLIKSLGASGKLRLTDGSSLTISGGAITMTNNLHGVDTEASAASDDLTAINGATETGEVLIIWPVDSARNIVVKHNVGNIVCKGESDITLDYVSDIAILIYNATTSDWVAFGISNTVIDGSGTAGRFTKWTDADTLQDANITDSITGDVLDLSATLTAGRTLTIADRDTTINGDITGGGVIATGGMTLNVANVVQKGDDYLEVTEQGSTPSTPAAGLIRLYAKTDGKFYYVDDAGTETEVGSDTDIGYIEHDAVKIGGVEVNLLNPADGELLVYNSGGSEAKFDPANLVKSGSVDVTPLFDGNTSNQWVSTEAVNWANFNFGYPAYVSKIVITAVNGDWMWADYPDDIYLFGSNTGDFTGEEIELDHYVPGGTGTYTRTYDAPRTAYRYYRMTFGRPSHGCRVNELEIYTVPAAYRFENQAMIHDATKIDGVMVDLTGITDGDALVYDGTKIVPGAGGGGGGGGSFHYYKDGALAVATGVCYWVATSDGDFSSWTITCKDLGSASSTIIDINKNGTTIFTTQGNRPTLAYDDADDIATGTPDVTTYSAGDIISLDIDQVATGASGLSVNSAIGASGSGSISLIELSATSAATPLSVFSGVVGNIIDNDDATNCEVTGGNPNYFWFTIDLGSEKLISQVKLVNWLEVGGADSGFSIQYSNSALSSSNIGTILGSSFSASTSAITTTTFGLVSARYLGLYRLGNFSANRIRLGEFRVYGLTIV